MSLTTSQTGYNVTSSKFDSTGIENPFYETSSMRDTLIEQMKNNIIIIDEPEVDNRQIVDASKEQAEIGKQLG